MKLVKVRVVQAFVAPRSRHQPGEVIEVSEVEAKGWTAKGLVVPVREVRAVEEAVQPRAHETAVLKGKR